MAKLFILCLQKANNPKQIILYEEAKLGLEEAGEQVHQVIYQWLVEHH
jgi:hypothetical protein